MFKKIVDFIVETIKEEWKFLLVLIITFLIFNHHVNCYIIVGGGVSDISSRVNVENKYQGKGSFNLSYVTQLDGTVLSYLLSYVIPTWERENPDNYKYTETETLEDIDFRSDLDLVTANGNATYWAYTLANKKVTVTSSKLYVIGVDNSTFKTNLKIKDQILSIDGKEFDTIKEYQEYIQSKNKDDEVSIRIIRDKKEQTITTPLHEVEGRLLLGIVLQYSREYEVNPKVKISFKRNESGPSAGLMTTLEIYNQLTKKDLTRGYKIAGTGTIEEDGSIGQIGGIEQKLLGANSAKVDYFLCASGKNCDTARKYIKNKNLKLNLIEVKTIQDAIEKLEELK